jgi:hypothetical protein
LVALADTRAHVRAPPVITVSDLHIRRGGAEVVAGVSFTETTESPDRLTTASRTRSGSTPTSAAAPALIRSP